MGDRDDLAAAIDNLGAVMKTVVFERTDLVLRDIHDELREAWTDVSAALSSVLGTLGKGGVELQNQLDAVGLLGASLRLKLRGFKSALERWHAGAGAGTLLSLLGWGNVFLGSLASVIPGGEVLKEYKEALEQGVKDARGKK